MTTREPSRQSQEATERALSRGAETQHMFEAAQMAMEETRKLLGDAGHQFDKPKDLPE